MSEGRIKSVSGESYDVLLDCLRSARRSARLTQVELAEKLGTDQSYISKYERGERRLDIVELRAICHALSLDLTEFVQTYEEQLKCRGLA
jgi:transcriptional regulator with XRE-family HTH domain